MLRGCGYDSISGFDAQFIEDELGMLVNGAQIAIEDCAERQFVLP